MSVARIYAKAFYEALPNKDQIGARRDELNQVFEAIQGSQSLKVALFSPATSSSEKTAILSALCSRSSFEPISQNFLQLLAKKGRLSDLGSVIEKLDEVRLEASGGLLGRVESADPLDSSDVQDLHKDFENKLKRPVEFKVSVDPELLAGLKVHVAGITFDGTLRSQLRRLKEEIHVNH